MKLLTLNCDSCNEEMQFEKIKYLAETIKEKEYDVICLQEVSQKIDDFIMYGNIKKSNYAYKLCEYLKKINCEYRFLWSFNHIGYNIYEEGVAILTKLKICNSINFYLGTSTDTSFWKTRKVLKVTLDKKGEKIDFYSCHLGWWNDLENSFQEQIKTLINTVNQSENRSFLMGDFNNISTIINEGYDLILKNNIFDTYNLAVEKDDGITVEGKIDGWSNDGIVGKRIDYIFTNKKVEIKKSEVIFNGKNKEKISDHYGVEVSI
ncbi:MAG: endonuclease/exonuclease/phosphatase family protein [Fusobacteriaceae bacterium]